MNTALPIGWRLETADARPTTWDAQHRDTSRPHAAVGPGGERVDAPDQDELLRLAQLRANKPLDLVYAIESDSPKLLADIAVALGQNFNRAHKYTRPVGERLLAPMLFLCVRAPGIRTVDPTWMWIG